MPEAAPNPIVGDFYQRLRKRPDLAGFSNAFLAAVALEYVESKRPLDKSGEEAAVAEVWNRAGVSLNPAQEGTCGATDALGAIVGRTFEGATQDIAGRHLSMVRQERTRRVISGVLAGLGGEGATLTDLLHGAGRAVTDSLVQGMGGVPRGETEKRAASVPLDAASTAQLAHAVSQSVQQVALNVQKMVAVALDAERTGDMDNPRYSSP